MLGREGSVAVTDATDVKQAAWQAHNSKAMEWGARAGLSARAFIYLLMGGLALAIASGGKSKNQAVNQKGALQQLTQHTGGAALLVLLAIGFAAYALWRFSEAAFGVVGDGDGPKARLQSAGRGLIYSSFCVTAISVLRGSSGSQSSKNTSLTAKVMGWTGGRFLIGIVGLAILAVGGIMIYEGAKKKFVKYLKTSEMSESTREAVESLGMVGTIARGTVIGLAGLLAIQAAWTYDAQKAGGLDVALKSLAGQPYGALLLGVMAVGLLAFGVYGFAEARWRKVSPTAQSQRST